MEFPVSQHPEFQMSIKEAKRAASTDEIIVIYGETGTGKEHLARAIHSNSLKAHKPFISAVISNIGKELFESELFGHEKGAFTGAEKYHKGAIEQASGGTLFIDEFQNVDFIMQQKILRLAESGEYRTVGGETVKKFQGRLLFAMNDHPLSLLERNILLPDMYYRIARTVLGIPPLRIRRQDIPMLIDICMRELCSEGCKLAPEDVAFIEEYDFPGNVRELFSLVTKAYTNRSDNTISLKQAWQLVHGKPLWYSRVGASLSPMKKAVRGDTNNILGVNYNKECKIGGRNYREAKEMFDRLFIIEALDYTGGNVTRAAEMIGIHRRHLSRKIKQYEIGVHYGTRKSQVET